MHTQPDERRVVVVGGGVVGCAAAVELARAGYDVTLLERDAIAATAVLLLTDWTSDSMALTIVATA